MSSDKKWLTFKTSDKQEFVVEESVGMMSNTVRNLVEDVPETSVISLEEINGKTMSKIIEFCKKHIEELDEDVLKEFDAQFLDLDQAVLFDLLNAANYLNIKDLLEGAIQKAADMIKGKSSEEIRDTFIIENDLSAEEEEESCRENHWIRKQ